MLASMERLDRCVPLRDYARTSASYSKTARPQLPACAGRLRHTELLEGMRVQHPDEGRSDVMERQRMRGYVGSECAHTGADLAAEPSGSSG
jgi:hypothetical protein